MVDHKPIDFCQVAMSRQNFPKTDAFFNRLQNKDNVALFCHLKRPSNERNNKETTKSESIIIANAHLHWDPQFRDIKLLQTAMMMEELEAFGASHNLPMTTTPTLICGDFNSLPDSGVYEFLANGRIPPDHVDFMGHTYGSYTTEGCKHNLTHLRNTHSKVDLGFTNWTPGFRGVIDYIWGNGLRIEGVLGGMDPDYANACIGFPNSNVPSDHIPIMIQCRLSDESVVDKAGGGGGSAW